MGGQSAEIIIQVPQEEFFGVLVDYESYPEFVGSVKTTEIVNREGREVLVYFELDLIKTVTYTLKMVEDKPQSLRWSLMEGDLFKVMNGSWDLEPCEEGCATKAIYGTEVDFSLFVPKMVTNRLVSVSLPNNLREFKERAEMLHRKN